MIELAVGAIADAVGDRPVFLLGCVLHLAFGIGCALARNATDLIASRALQGVALALCMPTAVGIITRNFEEGKKRNIAFACFSGGNPIGDLNPILLSYESRLIVLLRLCVWLTARWHLHTDGGLAICILLFLGSQFHRPYGCLLQPTSGFPARDFTA